MERLPGDLGSNSRHRRRGVARGTVSWYAAGCRVRLVGAADRVRLVGAADRLSCRPVSVRCCHVHWALVPSQRHGQELRNVESRGDSCPYRSGKISISLWCYEIIRNELKVALVPPSSQSFPHSWTWTWDAVIVTGLSCHRRDWGAARGPWAGVCGELPGVRGPGSVGSCPWAGVRGELPGVRGPGSVGSCPGSVVRGPWGAAREEPWVDV